MLLTGLVEDELLKVRQREPPPASVQTLRVWGVEGDPALMVDLSAQSVQKLKAAAVKGEDTYSRGVNAAPLRAVLYTVRLGRGPQADGFVCAGGGGGLVVCQHFMNLQGPPRADNPPKKKAKTDPRAGLAR
jgi:hypothetical protein